PSRPIDHLRAAAELMPEPANGKGVGRDSLVTIAIGSRPDLLVSESSRLVPMKSFRFLTLPAKRRMDDGSDAQASPARKRFFRKRSVRLRWRKRPVRDKVRARLVTRQLRGGAAPLFLSQPRVGQKNSIRPNSFQTESTYRC